MATVPYEPYPTVAPTTSGGDRYQRITSTPAAFGGDVAAAGERLGAGGVKFGRYLGQVAGDEAANEFQEESNKLLRGDPNKTNPDGTPDMGFLGLKGKAAVDARPALDKQIEELRKRIQGKMLTPEQQFHYDQFSRRQQSYVNSTFGNHADREQNQWITQTNRASGRVALDHIANNYDNPNEVAAGASDLINSYVKQAEHEGAKPGDSMWQDAVARGKRDALKAQLEPIAVRDPARAMNILEKNRNIAGVEYDNLANRYRARGDQQVGRETADRIVTGAPPPNGEDTPDTLRHFEGFKDKAYWDVNHWRVGYGSDTVTKADGSVVPVTQGMAVSREDAERDLKRRVAQTEGQIRAKIGGEAWLALPPNAKASLASVTYNYGDMPNQLVDVAKSGDMDALARSVRALGSHNGGVNAGRRASEANNIALSSEGAEGGIRPRSQVLSEIMNDPELRDRPQAQAAAIARVGHIYSSYDNAQIKQRAAFKQRVDDSVAEAQQTGTTTKPLTERDFTQHFGPEDGKAKYADYGSEVSFAADWQNLQTMSDVDQQQFLASRQPNPASPGYAHAAKLQQRLETGIKKIQEQRRDDPAGAVSRMQPVADAYKTYDPKRPESFKAVADARLIAQEQLGIEPEFRSPITKAEALKLTAPLRTMLPGDETRVLKDIGTKFQQMFGDQADKALSYAIRAHKVDAEVAQQAGNIVRKLRDGLPLTTTDAAPLGAAKEMSAADRALKGTIDEYQGMSDAASGVVPRAPSFEGSPVIQPSNVPPAAIEFLLKNPGSDAAFDKKYGSGRAKQLREKYPVAPGIP